MKSKTREITIDGKLINDESNCWVIAEIGHNHQGSVEKCKELIRQAKENGASAVKLQKRDNKNLFTAQMYNQVYDNPNSFGDTYGQHRDFLEFNRDQYVELQRYSKELNIPFFATAFDFASADFLADLNVPAFKMASGDLKNIPLMKYVAQFKKPMIISTGGANIEDVQRAYEAIMPINPQLAILQCTAGYPSEFHELNLKVIQTYRDLFKECVIGFSGHDNGIAMSLVAYTFGARIIEKHFTLNRAMKGTDHPFSLEPQGLRKMVRDIERARVAIGDGIKATYPSEVKPLQKMGKQIVAAKELPSGHLLTAADLALKSPGGGLPPYEWERVIGKRLLKPMKPDEALSFNMITDKG